MKLLSVFHLASQLLNYISNVERSRAFVATCYPEHFKNVAEEICRPLKVNKCVWILHDKDKFDDGTLKKPHYHLYLDFGDNSNHTCDELAVFLHVENMQFNEYIIDKPVQTLRKCQAACERYFRHEGYPGYQYPISELHTYNCSLQDHSIDMEQELYRLHEWINSCIENNTQLNWIEYQRELLNLGFGKWVLLRSAYFEQIYKNVFGNDRNGIPYKFKKKEDVCLLN